LWGRCIAYRYKYKEKLRYTKESIRIGECNMNIGMPKDGRFGDFGGKYIPETLVPAIEELEENYQ